MEVFGSLLVAVLGALNDGSGVGPRAVCVPVPVPGMKPKAVWVPTCTFFITVTGTEAVTVWSSYLTVLTATFRFVVTGTTLATL